MSTAQTTACCLSVPGKWLQTSFMILLGGSAKPSGQTSCWPPSRSLAEAVLAEPACPVSFDRNRLSLLGCSHVTLNMEMVHKAVFVQSLKVFQPEQAGLSYQPFPHDIQACTSQDSVHANAFALTAYVSCTFTAVMTVPNIICTSSEFCLFC